MGSALVVYCGLRLPWTASPVLNIGVTLLWLIGITNAVNLLDNMDGLAAGVVGIAGLFLGVCLIDNGQVAEAQLVAVFVAALLGFLIYNSNPASIFMGDCGSMFIGFLLAGLALLHGAGGRSRSLLPVLAAPVLVLAIPIYDTVLVTVLRKLAGRPASQGGRDHTSHRLVALGLSERRAVWLLYGLAAVAGILGYGVRTLQLDVSLALVGVFTLMLVFLGIYLAKVKVYDPGEIEAARSQPLVAFFVDLSYKRRIFEVLLDVALIILSYYLAQTLLFGSLDESGGWEQFARVIPVLVFVKLGAFLVMGVYRGLWRYMTVDDLVVYARAVVVATAASMLALLLLYRFSGLSRAVFALDAVILLVLLCGSRLLFRVLRRRLPEVGAPRGRRVLIYGANDDGELLLRVLRNHHTLDREVVGFADSDPRKQGTSIHGLRVFDGNGALTSVCRELKVDEVVLAGDSVPAERVEQLRRDCAEAQVPLRRLRLQIEELAAEETPPKSADGNR
jgi:UDP-GlcNAc:undecaprenyl-phosphate GlcNAc-1-phosphate transferase